METAVIQARLPKKLVKEMDSLVKNGRYLNRSDVIRQSVRELILDEYVGIIKNKGDSVKQVRKTRFELSKQKVDLDEINSYLK